MNLELFFVAEPRSSLQVGSVPSLPYRPPPPVWATRSFLLYMGRCKSLGSLESFLWYAPELYRASILYLALNLIRVPHWRWPSSGWLLDDRHPVSILSLLQVHHRGSCNVMAWWLQQPLFTDVVGNIFHSGRPYLLLPSEGTRMERDWAEHSTFFCCYTIFLFLWDLRFSLFSPCLSCTLVTLFWEK